MAPTLEGEGGGDRRSDIIITDLELSLTEQLKMPNGRVITLAPYIGHLSRAASQHELN